MFRIEKIGKKLWRNKGIYLIMVVEFTLGITFFSYSLNHIFSYMDNIKELGQELSDTTVSLEVLSKQEKADEDAQPFVYSDYAAIEDQAAGLEVFLCVPEMLLKDGEMKEIPFVYTNLLEGSKKFCLGTKISEKMKGEYQIYNGEEDTFSKHRIWYYGKKYERTDMPESLKDKIIIRNMSEGRIYAEQCVFFPIKDWGNEQIVMPAQVLIRYQAGDPSASGSTNQEIAKVLSKAHPEYIYQESNYMDDYEQYNESTMEYAKYMMVLSVIGIWIMVFGYMGLTKQFYIRRQKEFAVCLAVGATVRELFYEIVLENILVLACGIIVGNIGAWYLSDFQRGGILIVSCHMETVIISIVLALLIIAGINMPLYRKIYGMDPQELLRSI